MKLLSIFKKRETRPVPLRRKEFFYTFWAAVYDTLRKLGLTEPEAERSTGFILEWVFCARRREGSPPIKDLIRDLIRAAVTVELEIRRLESLIKKPLPETPRVEDYTPSLIERRLRERLDSYFRV